MQTRDRPSAQELGRCGQVAAVSAADQRSKAKDRKQMCGGLGLGTGWGVAANGSGASFCSEGNVLESQWWWLPSCECSTDR